MEGKKNKNKKQKNNTQLRCLNCSVTMQYFPAVAASVTTLISATKPNGMQPCLRSKANL